MGSTRRRPLPSNSEPTWQLTSTTAVRLMLIVFCQLSMGPQMASKVLPTPALGGSAHARAAVGCGDDWGAPGAGANHGALDDITRGPPRTTVGCVLSALLPICCWNEVSLRLQVGPRTGDCEPTCVQQRVVQPPKALHVETERGQLLRAVGDVARDRRGLPAQSLDLCGHLRRALWVDVGDLHGDMNGRAHGAGVGAACRQRRTCARWS